MEKLPKLYLSILLIIIVFSCTERSNLSKTERRALAEKTYNDAVKFRQGSTAFQNGIVDALAIDPEYEQGVYELSVAHLKRGMPHKWLPQYDKAVVLDSAYRIPWRGYLYLWFYRDYKKAIADFDASDTLTPNFIDAPQGHSVDYWRGVAYLGLKDYKNSIAYFEKHIKKETEEFGADYVDLNAFLYNGIAYYESGDIENALLNFDTQLKYASNLSADAKYYKAKILKEQQNKAEALVYINEAIHDYEIGYNNKRAYVETLRQLYYDDLLELKTVINTL